MGGYEPVSPVDMTAESKRQRSVGFSRESYNEKDERVTTRSVRTNSSSSTSPSVNTARKARFAEATSVMSPASGPGEHQSPFAGSNQAPQPSDVGFGYITESQPREQYATMRTDPNGNAGQPLKSALKTPGTASRLLDIRSPTFKEEMALEKQEESTDEQQANDLVSV